VREARSRGAQGTTNIGGRQMSAHILDTTGITELQLQENFTLGGNRWTTTALLAGVQSQFSARKQDATMATVTAAARSISGVRETGRGDSVSTVQKAVREALGAQGATLSEGKLATISKSVAGLAAIPRSTVMLSHGIGLTLYDNFTGGHKSGMTLLYERVSILGGQRLVSRWLTFIPMLH
jgi:hypothetical protein